MFIKKCFVHEKHEMRVEHRPKAYLTQAMEDASAELFEARLVFECLSCIFVDICISDLHSATSSTTACAAMPSPRPVRPSFSVVVAFTLTALFSTRRSAAMFSTI